MPRCTELEVAKALCLSAPSMTKKSGLRSSFVSDMLEEENKRKSPKPMCHLKMSELTALIIFLVGQIGGNVSYQHVKGNPLSAETRGGASSA